MSNEEIISAFLDDEPVDPQDLTSVLADPSGRELLVDLLILRRLVQPGVTPPPLSAAPNAWQGRAWQFVSAAAAALLLAVYAGYQLGGRAVDVTAAPPAPTVVVKSSGEWQDAGGVR